MATIDVFYTHIEVYPYKLGDVPRIEKIFSKYDTVTHKYIPIGYYIENDILYLPRGANIVLLQKIFNTKANFALEPDNYYSFNGGRMLFEPRDKIQTEAVDFLTCKGKFAKGVYHSQFGLNLDTGDGKTYCMTNAIMQLKKKAIVITHKQKLKEQWIATACNMVDSSTFSICDITGSDIIDAIINGDMCADIYYVNHQTLSSYARLHGWPSIRSFFEIAGIGVKVVDEAHKFFENSLMIDFFSNTWRSYYLTATFTRSDPKETYIFKLAYSSIYRFGEETMDYEEKRKHIIFIVVYYHSKPTLEERSSINTNHGFSSYKFIDYALNEDTQSMMRVLDTILKRIENVEGKTLIISPKIESVEYIASEVRKLTKKSVGTVHSKNSSEENHESFDCDIISSTIKSIGEGDDIKGLRVLINLEPIGSKLLADQLRGRLREYSKEDDTYMFYPVDTSIKECTDFLKRVMPVMKRKCKEIIITHLN